MMRVFTKFHPELSLWSSKVAIGSVAITCLLFFLVACGDDDRSSAPRWNEVPLIESSSSFALSSSEQSGGGSFSSSTDKMSSSSENTENSSSSSKDNSSSSEFVASSSSEQSSSSVVLMPPCKTETEDNCEYGELVDERDGQTYKTVKIGEQWWMAQNLNYAYLQPTKYLDSSSFCYNDSASYCEKYGRHYLWSAAMDSAGTWKTNGKGCGNDVMCTPAYPVRGICPEGWHLPSKDEWSILINAVGGSSTAGTKLKFTSGWKSSGNGTDAYSFSALAVGFRGDNGGFYSDGYYALFWSSTEYYDNAAYILYLAVPDDIASLRCDKKDDGFNVRCVKD